MIVSCVTVLVLSVGFVAIFERFVGLLYCRLIVTPFQFCLYFILVVLEFLEDSTKISIPWRYLMSWNGTPPILETFFLVAYNVAHVVPVY